MSTVLKSEAGMRADVKQLLETLTAERRKLDRAIDGLLGMNGATPTTPTVKTVRRVKKSRVTISAKVKSQISAAMTDAENKADKALALSKFYGVKYSTIYTSWRTWAKKAPVAATEAIADAGAA